MELSTDKDGQWSIYEKYIRENCGVKNTLSKDEGGDMVAELIIEGHEHQVWMRDV